MGEPEGAPPEDGDDPYISEALLLSMLPPAPPPPPPSKSENVAFLQGQLAMVSVFQERDDLRAKVKTLSEQNVELHARLKTQEPVLRERLEREVRERYRLLAEEIDRCHADGLRELDTEMYSKRPRLETHDSDDLQRVVRNYAERMRILLRTAAAASAVSGPRH